jgi:RNA polymerase sigma factor (sigma-70 family)
MRRQEKTSSADENARNDVMAPMTAGARTDAELVVAARDHEAGAYGELFQRWYDRSFDVALNILRDRESAADVAQDAFLTGWERLADLRAPAAFGGWILRTTRNRALNRIARDRSRSHEPIDTERDPSSTTPDPGTDPVVAVEREDQRRLVWTAVAVLGERDTSLLDLHLRHGLEPSEIAEELHITANNASQLLFRLRRKLRDAIGAVLLWRDGSPTCDVLAELLADSQTFDQTVASVIRQHRRSCPTCNRELSRQTDPERLFAAVPFAVAPLAMKEHAIGALTQAGAPMAASSATVSSAATASATAAAHGIPMKLLAIGGGVVGFGLFITIGLWPSGPGNGSAAQGSVPVSQEPTPPPSAEPTSEPTTSASPETGNDDSQGSSVSESTEDVVAPETSASPEGNDAGATTSDPTDEQPSSSTPESPVPPLPGPVVWERPEWAWCEFTVEWHHSPRWGHHRSYSAGCSCSCSWSGCGFRHY